MEQKNGFCGEILRYLTILANSAARRFSVAIYQFLQRAIPCVTENWSPTDKSSHYFESNSI